MVERWRQLPLDHALSYAARVRALVQSLADGVAEANGVPTSAVPDCGPATLMDQLTVMVYDASATSTAVTSVTVATADATSTAVTSVTVATADATSTAVTSTWVASTLAADLARLRRELA